MRCLATERYPYCGTRSRQKLVYLELNCYFCYTRMMIRWRSKTFRVLCMSSLLHVHVQHSMPRANKTTTPRYKTHHIVRTSEEKSTRSPNHTSSKLRIKNPETLTLPHCAAHAPPLSVAPHRQRGYGSLIFRCIEFRECKWLLLLKL